MRALLPHTARLYLLLLMLLVFAVAPVRATEVTRIVAAADLRFAMDEILERYRLAYPQQSLEVLYGSSGRFRAQIEHGAPFDLYFSADIAYPEALHTAGLVHGEVIPYALGRIVLWSDREDASALQLDDLTDARFRRIAIANPRHAPYGARAKEALQASGLWDALEPRLVYGENILHTLQLVQSGAAEIGIVALALAKSPLVAAEGDYQLIDDSLHQPLEQGFVITRRAADNTTAKAFADFVASAESRDIMQRYGFILPHKD